MISLSLGGSLAVTLPDSILSPATGASADCVPVVRPADSVATSPGSGDRLVGQPDTTDRQNPEAPTHRLAYHVPILMYHRVLPVAKAGNSDPSMVVSPELFSAQLTALHNAGWRTLTLRELASYMRTERPTPLKAFVITIDDGWSDGDTYALPIMRAFGYTATYFVIGGRIGIGSSLSVAQLRGLESAGDEIGNHTQSHVDLKHQTPSRAKQEIEKGSDAIARAVGHRPVSFSYPMGGSEPWVVALVAATPDLEIAVTTGRGPETWATRYEMPRLPMSSMTSPQRLLMELAGGG